MESLLEDLSSLLRLATVTLKTLPRVAAPALSSFGLAFLIGFGTSSWCAPLS